MAISETLQKPTQHDTFEDSQRQNTPNVRLKRLARKVLPGPWHRALAGAYRDYRGPLDLSPLTYPHLHHMRLPVAHPVFLSAASARELAKLRAWEQTERPMLERFCEVVSRKVVFDVGASQGLYSLSAVAAGAREVHAFEPHPAFAPMIAVNATASGLENITAHNVALGESDGNANLFMNESFVVSPSMTHQSGYATCRPVPVRSVDSLVSSGELPCPEVMKIDVEGFEGNVLRGMTSQIMQCLTDIFLEAHEHADTPWVLRWLDGHGFKEQWRHGRGGELHLHMLRQLS